MSAANDNNEDCLQTKTIDIDNVKESSQKEQTTSDTESVQIQCLSTNSNDDVPKQNKQCPDIVTDITEANKTDITDSSCTESCEMNQTDFNVKDNFVAEQTNVSSRISEESLKNKDIICINDIDKNEQDVSESKDSFKVDDSNIIISNMTESVEIYKVVDNIKDSVQVEIVKTDVDLINFDENDKEELKSHDNIVCSDIEQIIDNKPKDISIHEDIVVNNKEVTVDDLICNLEVNNINETTSSSNVNQVSDDKNNSEKLLHIDEINECIVNRNPVKVEHNDSNIILEDKLTNIIGDADKNLPTIQSQIVCHNNESSQVDTLLVENCNIDNPINISLQNKIETNVFKISNQIEETKVVGDLDSLQSEETSTYNEFEYSSHNQIVDDNVKSLDNEHVCDNINKPLIIDNIDIINVEDLSQSDKVSENTEILQTEHLVVNNSITASEVQLTSTNDDNQVSLLTKEPNIIISEELLHSETKSDVKNNINDTDITNISVRDHTIINIEEPLKNDEFIADSDKNTSNNEPSETNNEKLSQVENIIDSSNTLIVENISVDKSNIEPVLNSQTEMIDNKTSSIVTDNSCPIEKNDNISSLINSINENNNMELPKTLPNIEDNSTIVKVCDNNITIQPELSTKTNTISNESTEIINSEEHLKVNDAVITNNTKTLHNDGPKSHDNKKDSLENNHISTANIPVVSVHSTNNILSETKEKLNVVNKLQGMNWLKTNSATTTKMNEGQKLTLKSLPKKEERAEIYFEGTKKNSHSKGHRSYESKQDKNSSNHQDNFSTTKSANLSKEIMKKPEKIAQQVISGQKEPNKTTSSIWNSNTATELFPDSQAIVIDRKKEEEEYELAIVESICTAQQESERRKMADIQKHVRFQIQDDSNDDSWGKIHPNIPNNSDYPNSGDNNNNQNYTEGSIDKFGRVDGCTEKHLFMGKGARKKEQEFLKENLEKKSQLPNNPGFNQAQSISKTQTQKSNLSMNEEHLKNKNQIPGQKTNLHVDKPTNLVETNISLKQKPGFNQPVSNKTSSENDKMVSKQSQDLSNKKVECQQTKQTDFNYNHSHANRNYDNFTKNQEFSNKQQNYNERNQNNTYRKQDQQFNRYQNYSDRNQSNLNRNQEQYNRNQNYYDNNKDNGTRNQDNFRRNSTYYDRSYDNSSNQNYSGNSRDSATRNQDNFKKNSSYSDKSYDNSSNQNYSDRNKDYGTRNQDNFKKNSSYSDRSYDNSSNQNYSDKNKDHVTKNQDNFKRNSNYSDNSNDHATRNQDNFKKNLNYSDSTYNNSSNQNYSDRNKNTTSKPQEILGRNQNYQTKHQEISNKTQDCIQKTQTTDSRYDENLNKRKGNENWDDNESKNIKTTSDSQKHFDNNQQSWNQRGRTWNQEKEKIVTDKKAEIPSQRDINERQTNLNVTSSTSVSTTQETNNKSKQDICKSKNESMVGNNNGNVNSELRPNVVMAFEGNQNVQRALGINPSISHQNTIQQISKSDTSSITTSSGASPSYLDSNIVQNFPSSNPTQCTNLSEPMMYADSTMNANAPSFSTNNFNNNPMLSNQYLSGAEQSIPNPNYGFLSAPNANAIEQQHRMNEISNASQELMRHYKMVSNLSKQLASAQASLLAAQMKVYNETISCSSFQQGRLPHPAMSAMSQQTVQDCNRSPPIDFQSKYSTPPNFQASMPSMQKVQSDNFEMTKNFAAMNVQNLGNEKLQSNIGLDQRLDLQPMYNPQHNVYLQAANFQQYHPNPNVSMANMVPRGNVMPHCNEPRELRGSGNQFYNK